ncbi:MAG: dipeptidase [Deltaproteobacteria bacterium]
MFTADLHCDTISAIFQSRETLLQNSGHFDLERAIQAGIRLQVFALFVSPAEGSNMLRQVLKQVDYFHEQIAVNPDLAYLVSSYDDLRVPGNNDKIGCLLHLEGADALGGELELLRLMYRLGLRSLGLTWNHRNNIADGVLEGDPGAGLSRLGRKMVQEMDRLAMVLDLAHVAPASFYEAAEIYSRPVMVSHANVRKLCDFPRNLSDDQIKTVARKDGIIGATMVSDFVRKEAADINDLLDHMVYIAETIGVRHLALGSDFDGATTLVMPGVEGYNEWGSLLAGRGFSAAEQEMILGGNACRLIKAIL